jgi:tetratricopeptide (TPR) repeat protein
MVDRTVSHYGGIIARCDPMMPGDKLLILFGAPISHENDAEHAIRCALDLNAGLASLQSALRHRIGIATGHVFCGNVGPPRHREYTVIGDTANLAARLMSIASDGKILVSASTLRGLEDRLEVKSLPHVKVKGFAQPVQAYRVTGWRATHTRLKSSGIHRIIDRRSELGRLQIVINQACSGQGQAICITGPAGIGKSALSRAAIKRWQKRGGDVYIGSCEAYGERIPYLPWVEILENLFGLSSTDTADTRRQKIIQCASDLVPEWQDRLSPLVALLGVPVVEATQASQLDPRLYQQHLHEIIASLLCALAQQRPLMMTISDLHWSDRASLDLIRHIAYNIDQYPILLLLTCRLDTNSHNKLETIFDTDFVLEIGELSKEDSRAMASSLLDDAQVSEELLEQIWAISRGNPLYLREVLRYLQEQGYLGRVKTTHCTLNCNPGSIPIPDSIERVIVTALDRLDEPSRQVIKMAAVIGRLFRFRTLSALCSLPPEWLQAVLDTLIDQQMICLEEDHQELTYAFCAPQMQEVTYETLAFAQRRQLHCELARFLEHEATARPKRYALLAHHYDLGQAFSQAFEYHGKAGDQARKTYANHEALHHYQRALDLLPELPSPPKPRVVSLLQRDLGRVCRFLGQYEEAQKSYAQGLALARQHNDLQAEAENLVWMSDLCYVQGDSEGVLVNARRATNLAEQTGDAELLELGLEYIGGGLMLEGALDEALECFTRCLDLSQTLGNPQGLRRSLNNIGLIHVSQRQFGPAIAAFGQALQLARELRDDFYITVLANNLGELYQELGDTATALPLHEEALSKARRLGVRDFECDCLRNLGVDYARQGQVRRGLNYLTRSLSLAQETSLTVGEAAVLFNLGEVYLIYGRSSEAFATAQDLKALSDRLDLTVLQQRTHLLLGLVHCALGEWTPALTALELAAALWEREPIGLVGWQSYHALKEVYSRLGQMSRAQNMLDRTRQIEAKVIASIEDKDLRRIFLESSPMQVGPYAKPALPTKQK